VGVADHLGTAVADDRDLPGDVDPAQLQHAETPGRHRVVGVDDRRRRLGPVKKGSGGRGTGCHQAGAHHAQSVGPGGPHGPRERRPAPACVKVLLVAGHLGDADVVPEVDEVLDFAGGANRVVEVDRRQPGGVVEASDQQGRKAELLEHPDAGVLSPQIGEGDLVDPLSVTSAR
jgi:hypothetical protein